MNAQQSFAFAIIGLTMEEHRRARDIHAGEPATIAKP
jgi:hypothetical protein